MRILFLLFSICFFGISSVFADTTLLVTHIEKDSRTLITEKLRSIITLDHQEFSRSVRIRRNILLSSLGKDFATLYRTWNLRPTFDATPRYTPYLQKYSLSCEIAALSIVLKSLGSIETEDTLIARLPNFPESLSGGVWGDPDKEFVGSITGSQRLATGYGVYGATLAHLVEDTYFTELFSLTGGTLDDPTLAQEKMSQYLQDILHGGHVILWGDWCTSGESEDGILSENKSAIIKLFPLAAKNECKRNEYSRIMNWVTLSGTHITGLSGEHAFVLLGYMGKVDHPTHLIIWDTDTGRHIYPINEWMRKWKLLDYRALLIKNFE